MSASHVVTKLFETDIDDPEAFIHGMKPRRARPGGLCSVICPKCGVKKQVLKNWPDGLESDVPNTWGNRCDCGHFLPLSTYFAESEDIDYEKYVQQASLTKPGYFVDVPPGPGVYQIYATHQNGAHGFDTSVGTIYDTSICKRYDEDDMPFMATWGRERWRAVYKYDPDDYHDAKTYELALNWLISHKLKENADPDDPKHYVQQVTTAPPGFTVKPDPSSQGLWGVYKNHGVSRNGYTQLEAIGQVRYNPQADGNNWKATPLSPATVPDKFHPTFEKAVQYVTDAHMRHYYPNESMDVSDPDDPERYLQQAGAAPPGFIVQPESVGVPGIWNVFKKYSDDPDDIESIGTVRYDPQDDVPANADPEWKNIHWLAMPNYFRAEGRFHYTFEQAVKYLVDVYVKQYPTESLEVPGSGDVRHQFEKFYESVLIHTEPSDKGTKWVIACSKAKELLSKADFESLLAKWSARNHYNALEESINGLLRHKVTFTFTTEAVDIDDPDAFMDRTLPKIQWEQHLLSALREFHPAGTLYQVLGNEKHVLISSTTYFEPSKDDWNKRYFEVVNAFLKKIVPNGSVSRLYYSDNSRKPGKNYPEWYSMISVNFDMPNFTPVLTAVI